MQYYNLRVRKGLQPRTPFINVFDVRQQNTLLIVANAIYLLVTIVLFIIMKKKQTGYRLRWLLVIYDAMNVIVAAYIAISIVNYKLGHGGLLLCNSISNDEEGHKIANIFVLFYFQKYFEFIDTWFFILRKSKRQVTLLHLFHHSSITIVVGTILPFDYNGDMYLPILFNSASHMLVYLHYLLASLGIQSLWAKYITSMQLGQFIIIFGQSLISYRVGPTCGSPDFAKVLMTWYMGSLIGVFGNFFLQVGVSRLYLSISIISLTNLMLLKHLLFPFVLYHI
jgi:elongation of very long chain fatty acids protein 4